MEIGVTRLVAPGENVDDNVTLDIENPILIHIKKCNKTDEPDVNIEFYGKLTDTVKMLANTQVAAGKKHLFTKNDGSPSTAEWFNVAFNNAMLKIYSGKSVTLESIRIAIGINLSKDDHGDLEYQDNICRYMGHSYAVHQRFYNMYKNI
ncbi:hypothetical protein HDU89_001149 [Geranomyces variabilis]|nr:hypothetical protein HDU89_001149 [Geranomyces variabilis]